MNSAATRKQVELALANRVSAVFARRKERQTEILPTGIVELDSSCEGFPRGAITEIHGASSSGRISLMLSVLAGATKQDESCVLIDCSDTFDLSSASAAGVDFNRLLWVRCSDRLEAAFKSLDLVLHGGGFGVVVLNLVDVPAKNVRRIVSSWWFRFRRAIENTSTVLIVLTPIAAVRSCAGVVLEVNNKRTVWRSTLSLVSENSYSSFTNKRELDSHLSLVTRSVPNQRPHFSHTHSQFLQSTEILANRERPLDWSSRAMKFHPLRV